MKLYEKGSYCLNSTDNCISKVDVTIFAENNDGRDTRDFTFYI